ncbi:hypothetical protein B8B82_05545 [Pseudomonas aeruginosa]|uniref:hypothetical protein n=1 Tax=Pseudomonas aeruginosa TaxID=287 RepID=UPI00098643A0|nr:hypothetical protein [Pseudomonas aeruginosa]PBL43715.1 hypothetical protein B8B68_01115 [Pseudomonas aeruginosa]PBN11817.1 hypothetical protein B8B69_25620 [Pseudomonas aeruginosa]PBN14543.1 hypothetical protein B8A61_01115 [Pseudomonas aeruginosa]PBN19839.1 hypothetical protein B8B71_06990 [Pseudomonas aeruginosa]PBN35905.1 hypothetical protein B8B81_05545 [Pseudomonas aeruginosa]
MSSTQHQLIEQCATRLRGIVEALDNIHDSTPHRWSTDLDDVHSSAESLLAMIKDQAPARPEASFEEWLANELEGEDGQPVPAADCDITLARRAFNHWPKLEQPAKVGGVRFSAGVSSRLVVEAAQRLYEFESTPEKEAERIEQLQAFREQLDPLNLAPHAEAFNEAPAEVLKPEQAERPEVVGVRYEDGTILSAEDCGIALEVCARVQTPLMTVAQHERIVEARWNRAMDLLLDHVSRISEKFKAERDAALARVAKMERQEPVAAVSGETFSSDGTSDIITRNLPIGTKLYANPVAQAGQVPQAWLDVQAERRRQITAEGWTPEHDDEHADGQMAQAAGCYALHAGGIGTDWLDGRQNGAALFWPWDKDSWKPTTPRRDLVKACALALAEIERLDRATATQGGPRDA